MRRRASRICDGSYNLMERLGIDTKLSVDLTSDKPELWGAMSLNSLRGGQVIYSIISDPPCASNAGSAGLGVLVPTIDSIGETRTPAPHTASSASVRIRLTRVI